LAENFEEIVNDVVDEFLAENWVVDVVEEGFY
jgi:hypothetical protein